MYESSAITGKPSDEPKSSTKFFRAPLLWILCPQIAAYVLCECGFSLAPTATLIASGTAFLCAFISVTVAFLGKGEKESVCNDLWTFFLPVAVFFLAGAWWSCQVPKFVNWSGKPETEVVIDAEIETPFRSSGKSWSGLARVLTASEGGESLCGARIFYQFSKSETNTTPREGMRIHLRGIATAGWMRISGISCSRGARVFVSETAIASELLIRDFGTKQVRGSHGKNRN